MAFKYYFEATFPGILGKAVYLDPSHMPIPDLDLIFELPMLIRNSVHPNFNRLLD